MLNTTQDMYLSFLDGIKKQSSAYVDPELFNRIINEWGQQEYMKQNVFIEEINQKQIEDLEKIRVVTDGLMEYEGNILYPIAPDANNELVFSIPKYINTGIRNRLNNGTISSQDYPKYAQMLNVMFKLTYGQNDCGLEGVSDWNKAWIMRSDQRAVHMDNPRRKPTRDRIYYEMINGKVRLITDNVTKGYALRLEYFRFPIQIFFNQNNPADTQNPVTGSVCCEFAPNQRKEIVDIAVRVYLERVSDPRYKTFLNEEGLRAITN